MKKLFKFLSVLAIWISVWYIIARIVNAEYLIPYPHIVIKTLGQLALTGDFWHACLSSLFGVLCGIIIGTVFGVIIAVLSSISEYSDSLLSPLVAIIKATPVASFILLALIFLKKGYVPTFVSALIVIPITSKNVQTGIQNTDKNLLEAARVFNMNKRTRLKYIYLPSVLPHFASAMTTSIGMAWKAGIAAEVICSPHNTIGYFLYRTKIYFDTPALFAWTLCVIVLSFIIEKIVGQLLKRVKNES